MLLGLALIVLAFGHGVAHAEPAPAPAGATDPTGGPTSGAASATTQAPVPVAEPATSAQDIYQSFDTSSVSPNRPVPTLRATAQSQAIVGSAVTVDVTVAGTNAAGEIVVLERHDPDGWPAVASARVDASDHASLVVTLGASGAASYRAWIASTTQHTEATSAEVGIDVVDAVPGDPGSAAQAAMPDPTTSPAGAPTETAREQLCGAEAVSRIDGSPWVCTYDDEFDGSALDRRYWIAQQSARSGFVTGTPTQPACVIDDPSTISVSAGELVLSARQLGQPVTCGKTTSSQVSGMVMQLGTFAQTYGRWEVRAKVPSWAGKGLQETFWLWPLDQLKYGPRHPDSGEIDFAEFYSSYSKLTVPFMHYDLDQSTVSYATSTNIYTSYNCTIRPGEYNTYGLEWTPGLLRILLNGQVCITNHYLATNAPPGSPYAPFDSPFFLALTQAFGTTGNEFDPATGPAVSSTEVDYVRVWR